MDDAVTPLFHFWQPRYWPIWLGVGMLRLVVMLPRRGQLWVARRIGGRFARSRTLRLQATRKGSNEKYLLARGRKA